LLEYQAPYFVILIILANKNDPLGEKIKTSHGNMCCPFKFALFTPEYIQVKRAHLKGQPIFTRDVLMFSPRGGFLFAKIIRNPK
jgi:hypothetical protein